MTKKLLSFTKVRESSNLIPKAEYQFSKSELSKRKANGFLGVFIKSNTYKGDAFRSLLKVALGALSPMHGMSQEKPKPSKTPEGKEEQKQQTKAMGVFIDNRTKSEFHKLTRLKKVNGTDPHFILSLPILETSASSVNYHASLFGAPPLDVSVAETIADVVASGKTASFPKQLAISGSGVGQDLARMLQGCLNGVTVERSGNDTCVFYLEFKIDQEEAEFFTSTDWLEIRPIDLYPMFSMWAEADYRSNKYGKSAIAVSRIASTLPPHDKEDIRIDENGLCVGLDGKPMFIPEVCNNTDSYENAYTAAAQNSDGSFSLRGVDPATGSQKNSVLPANKPILVDWTNNKFSYTNTSGKIEILALEHTRKCTPSMAKNLLTKRANLNTLSLWVGIAETAGLPISVSFYMSQKDVDEKEDSSWPQLFNSLPASGNNQGITVRDTLAAVARIEKGSNPDEDEDGGKKKGKKAKKGDSKPNANAVKFRYIDMTGDGDPALRWVARFALAVFNAARANIESVYTKYAVSTVTSQLGFMGLLGTYGKDFATLSLNANTANSAAMNQSIDPKWKPPAVPLITSKFASETGGILPHQARVRNLLKDSPAFAVLSVAAGGGKSLLSITDILYEIKANRSAPYLIMCPSHLVANYVSEIVEFTDGTVNVIPVTSKNFRSTGIKRYEQMLEVAPINTILIVDYDSLKFRSIATVYGTTEIEIFPVVELIRKFKPGYAMLDECHLLKNAKSARYKAVMSLIADIPKKRIASGTLNPDSPSDLPSQIAMMDPSIFGSRDEFNEEYAEEMKGSRVIRWKKTAGQESLSRLKGSMVWAEAKRREWAAALPPREDRFIPVELTPRQREVYEALFDDMVMSIKESAKGKDADGKKAKRVLQSLMGKKASKSDEDDFGDLGSEDGESGEDILEEENDIGAGLQPYLSALEVFVSNPASHPYARDGWVTDDGGSKNRHPPLSGDDLKSPKALAMEAMLKDWFKTNTSKAIVFTNYFATASSLFEAMPPELQASGILYEAGSKEVIINKFKKDPKVKWMIGIRKSLEVGLNLQQAGYMIRMEGVWTPGEQEQGDSRIARPYFGPGGDQRTALRFDTIVADRTIDVTKAARLRAKMVALAKFENSADPAYQSIPDIPLFTMTLANIVEKNDFQTGLVQYQDSMEQLNSVIKADYAQYKAQVVKEGGFKFVQLEKASTPPGAQLMSRVPYAHGTELYSSANLGLVRADNFVGLDLTGEMDDDEGGGGGGGDDDEQDEQDATAAESNRQKTLLIGQRCHTELGDGEIIAVGFNKKTLNARGIRVRLDDGTTAARLHPTAVFIVTREETNGIDMRNAIARAAGLEVTGPITVPAENVAATRITKKMLREQEREREEKEKAERKAKSKKKAKAMSVSLSLSVINGYLRIGYTPTDDSVARAMQALGFKADQPYVYAVMRSGKQLLNQAILWKEAGFELSRETSSRTLEMLYETLTKNSLRSHRHYVDTINAGEFKNFMRMTWKPSPDENLLHAFSLVTDEGPREPSIVKLAEKEDRPVPYSAAYLCMPYGGGFPATTKALKYKAPGVVWKKSEDDLSIFVSGMNAVHKVFALIKDAGIQISNVDELNVMAKSVKKVSGSGEGLKKIGIDIVEDESVANKDARKAPAKKAPAKKAPPAKAPVKKAPPAKAPVKKAPAKPPAKKAPLKAPVKKAPPAKAPVKKAPAKAPAKKPTRR